MIDTCGYFAIIISSTICSAIICSCIIMKFIKHDSDDDCCCCDCNSEVSNLHRDVIIVQPTMNPSNNVNNLPKYGEEVIYDEFVFQNELPSPPNYSEIRFE